MIAFLPLILMALSVPLVLLTDRNTRGTLRPRECDHPWYMDGRCIVCGTPGP